MRLSFLWDVFVLNALVNLTAPLVCLFSVGTLQQTFHFNKKSFVVRSANFEISLVPLKKIMCVEYFDTIVKVLCFNSNNPFTFD
jgi:hypothetical protein